ncbi:olfactory receptor, family 51, subfamily B, member 4 [Homo sapiens]|nr:HOR 5'Beta1 [Homo sapiens]EAW68801.1 olfactory receptor, family 51, subfamily B, member 4 [Homo sapiens]KAI2558354.1 olfactory receptor family 51 subfamily B member 4 [Homo sapiens]
MWYNNSAGPFLLTGFLGSEAVHYRISMSFFVIYFSILFGNGTLLVLIWNDHSLHEPMYYFLAMLADTDLGMTFTTMPTVLGVLLLDQREIAHAACFTQSFIHSLAIVESGILLVLAYDCFIAIRTPLRYNCILTNSRVMNIGLGVLMRGFMSILPIILSLYCYPYCGSRALLHTFCLHQDVIKLACADITFNHIYPIIQTSLTVFLDALIIIFSYILILKTVMGIASGQEEAKSLNTCVSHISCVLVFHITVMGLSFIHRFGKHAPHVVPITMSYVHFLFPPFVNPIIYSIKTKQIQRSIIRLFSGQSRA